MRTSRSLRLARGPGGGHRRATLAREFDAVELVCTRYVTKVSQEVAVRRLLPFEFHHAAAAAARRRSAGAAARRSPCISWSPRGQTSLLALIVPMAMAAELFCSILEAMLGEQAQRSLAMRSASDNADSMTKRLTRTYNRARQAQITSEMIEIISGSEGGRE